MQRIVHAFVGPDRGERDNPDIDLADRAEIVARDVSGLRPRLAIASIIEDQHPLSMRACRRRFEEQG